MTALPLSRPFVERLVILSKTLQSVRKLRFRGVALKSVYGNYVRMLPDHYLQSVELKESAERNENDYPFCIPAIRSMAKIEFHPKVTFFVGENGSGKSTLLEALAVGSGFGEEGGTKNVRVATADTVSGLKHRN